MYEKGRNVEKDGVQAVAWYTKAAEQGHIKAQNDLSLVYDNGQGVTKDDDKAITWYRRAATHGNLNAQAILRRRGLDC